MFKHHYSVKNYSKAYFEDYIQFCSKADIFNISQRETVFNLIAQKFKRPQYLPQENLFLALCDNHIVGFLEMTPELKIGRIILNGYIHPEHRRLGLATEMFGAAWDRVEDLDVNVIHVCLPEFQKPGRFLMKKLDFVPVRRFFKLEKEMSDVIEEEPPAAIELGNFQTGEEALLAEIQNRCFSGSWGFCPNSPAEIKYYLDWTGCPIGDIHSARLKKDKRIIGYCWAHLLKREIQARSKSRGRIHMFGVDPTYQGQGLGKALLFKGFRVLKDKGAGVVELTVDKENRFALGLYQSSGFKKVSTSIWYEKIL